MDFSLLPAVADRGRELRDTVNTVRETTNTVRDVAGTVRRNPRGSALAALSQDPATQAVTQIAQQATTLLASPAQTQEEQDEREESREAARTMFATRRDDGGEAGEHRRAPNPRRG